MNWTNPLPPDNGETSYCDHVIAKTPLGNMIIEWKNCSDGTL